MQMNSAFRSFWFNSEVITEEPSSQWKQYASNIPFCTCFFSFESIVFQLVLCKQVQLFTTELLEMIDIYGKTLMKSK